MAQLWDLGLRGTALDVVAAWKEVLLLVALVAAAWYVRRLPAVTAADVLALVYAGDRRPVLASPAGLARWGRDRARRAARAPPSPPAGRGLRARPPALGALARRAARAGHRAHRGRGRADRPARPRLRLAPGVARLGRPRLVPRPARPELRRPLRPARELGLQHRRREQPDSPTRLDVPLAARERVLLRRRPHLPAQPPVSVVDDRALAARLRRAALHPHACGRGRARRRPRRPRRRAAAPCSRRPRGRLRSSCLGGVLRRVPEHRAVDELHAGGARVPARRTPSRSPGRARIPFSPSESSLASHWRNLRDGVEAILDHPQGYGLGNAGVVAKRTGVEIKAGESTYVELGINIGIAGLAAFVLWSVFVLLGLLRQGGLGRGRLRRRPPARAPDGRHRRALARGRGLGRRGHGARLETRRAGHRG